MNVRKFSDAMSELDTKYVDEALNYKKKAPKSVWVKWGAIAACLCIVVTFIIFPLVNEQVTEQNGGGIGDNNGSFFNATVIELTDDTVTVKCIDGMDSGFTNGDIISFGTEIVAKKGLPAITAGDTVRIIYNDTSVKYDPLRIDIVFNVYLIDDDGNILPN